MPKTNANATRTKAQTHDLVLLDVLGRRAVTPHMVRVTLGGRDIDSFRYLGYDQWFRLFIPVGDDSLARVPKKLTMLSYLKFLAVSKTERPVLRNYSVRAFRADGETGPEMDVDFVVHGGGEHAGPASEWAQTCAIGSTVALLDEGYLYGADDDTDFHFIVVDESGLPAAAGIAAALPRDAVGLILAEVPTAEDAQEFDPPPGVEVRFLPRGETDETPGQLALREAVAVEVPGDKPYASIAGEQGLVTALRRHLVASGMAKDRIAFTGYWRVGRAT